MKNGHLKIERGIAITNNRGRAKGELALLMEKMMKGDSVYVEKSNATLQQTASRYIGVGKYAIRAEGKGFRVWKTA